MNKWESLYNTTLEKDGYIIEVLKNKNYTAQASITKLQNIFQYECNPFGGFNLSIEVFDNSNICIDKLELEGLNGSNKAAINRINKMKTEFENKYFKN